MEQLYKDQSTLRRMREGPLGQHLLADVLAMLVPQQQAAYRETVGSNTRSGSLRYHARHIDHRTRFDPNRPTRK
ncbi:MAG: hypothetical protein IPI44_00165 [Sulfuritalea sp.]|nr:hypothetical protein [Sulfuritalea sp.]